MLTPLGPVDRLVCDDQTLDKIPSGFPGLVCVQGDLCDPAIRQQALGELADFVFHLAALDGESAEREPQASRSINLGLSLALWDDIACWNSRPRVVFTSTKQVHHIEVMPEVEDSYVPSPNVMAPMASDRPGGG